MRGRHIILLQLFGTRLTGPPYPRLAFLYTAGASHWWLPEIQLLSLLYGVRSTQYRLRQPPSTTKVVPTSVEAPRVSPLALPPSGTIQHALRVGGASVGAVACGWHAPAHFPKKEDDTPCLRVIQTPLHNKALIGLPPGSCMGVIDTAQRSHQINSQTYFQNEDCHGRQTARTMRSDRGADRCCALLGHEPAGAARCEWSKFSSYPIST